MADTINLDSLVERGSSQIHTEIGGQVFMMSLEKGKYFAAEDVGARIWHLLAEPMSLRDVRDTLLSEFDVDPDRCETEVIAFASALLANDLIKLSPG